MSGESWHEQFQPEPGSLEEERLVAVVQHDIVVPPPSSSSPHHRPANHSAMYVEPGSPQSVPYATPSFDGSAHIHPEVSQKKISVSHQRYGSYDSQSQPYYPGPPPPHHHRHHQRYSQYHNNNNNNTSPYNQQQQQQPYPNAGLAHYHPAMLPSLSQHSNQSSSQYARQGNAPLLRHHHRQQHSGYEEMEQLRKVWLCLEMMFLAFYTGAAIVSYLKRVYIFTILWTATLIFGLINTNSVCAKQNSASICGFCEGVLVLVAAGSSSYVAITESGWNSWLGIIVLGSCILFAQFIPRFNFRNAERFSKYRLCLFIMGSKYYVAFDHGICKTGYSLFTQYETDRSIVHVAHLASGLMEHSFPWSFCADSTPAVFYLVSQALTLYIVLFETSSLKGKLYVW